MMPYKERPSSPFSVYIFILSKQQTCTNITNNCKNYQLSLDWEAESYLFTN